MKPAPVKTSAEIQQSVEKKRMTYADRGFASTILTSGFGDVSPLNVSGVSLGVA